MDAVCLKTAISTPSIAPASFGFVGGGGGGAFDARTNPSTVSATVGRTAAAANAISAEKPPEDNGASSPSKLIFGFPLRYLWPGGGGRKRYRGMAVDDAVLVEDREKAEGGEARSLDSDSDSDSVPLRKNGNWILKILHATSRSTEKEKVADQDSGKETQEDAGDPMLVHRESGRCVKGDDNEEAECGVCRVDYEEEGDGGGFGNRDSFSKLLRRVTLGEAKLYAQMSYLGNLAYFIPNIKARNLLRYYNLRFVTSSMEKKQLSTKSEKDPASIEASEAEGMLKETLECKEGKNSVYRISVTAAYEIVATAASYLHHRTRGLLPFKSSNGKACESLEVAGRDGNDNARVMDSDVASFMATTDSVTAVVAAKEEVKQAVADNLKSTRSSPCEWFICDDDQTRTRFFVIQGSESLASWQANLLFEPIQFEGHDVLVHRGIYEAAKGIYEQMLPEVHAHLKSHGNRASFYFTGHSLGGSLALLVNFMLLIRGEVPLHSLLPVITFGSPSVLCGGNRLLHKLKLPRSHVRAITMHRDIVPRAFSCNYPNHVAEILKAVNKKFRSHPCLNNQKVLYAPFGELLILQPDEKFSPHHGLLPKGSGFYLLSHSLVGGGDPEGRILAAQMVFLNSPHPLETLRDRSSYGSEGTIERDHDMNSYVKCIRAIIRQELNSIRKARREQRRKVWWAVVMPRGVHVGAMRRRPVGSTGNSGWERFEWAGILYNGTRSLRRLTKLVAASQQVQLLVVLLFPARFLVMGVIRGFSALR